MATEFTQTGGFRWGAWNVTAPFAELRASRELILIKVSFWKFWQRTFEFSRQEIKTITKFYGIFSVGILISHTKRDYPAHIIFWTFDYKSLKEALASLDYVLDGKAKSYLDLF